MNQSEDDYIRYRGKCKEMSEELVRADTALRLVRGHYWCPILGEQAHWWAVDSGGTVIDPTARQFPSKGCGEYIEFDGKVDCAECGVEMDEKQASFHGNYGFCSTKCAMRFVGL